MSEVHSECYKHRPKVLRQTYSYARRTPLETVCACVDNMPPLQDHTCKTTPVQGCLSHRWVVTPTPLDCDACGKGIWNPR